MSGHYVKESFGFGEDDARGYRYLKQSLELGSAVGMVGARRVGGFTFGIRNIGLGVPQNIKEGMRHLNMVRKHPRAQGIKSRITYCTFCYIQSISYIICILHNYETYNIYVDKIHSNNLPFLNMNI